MCCFQPMRINQLQCSCFNGEYTACYQCSSARCYFMYRQQQYIQRNGYGQQPYLSMAECSFMFRIICKYRRGYIININCDSGDNYILSLHCERNLFTTSNIKLCDIYCR